MKQSEELRELLHSIHRKSYPAYKGLKGIYDFRTYRLSIDHVQGDPFASPSSISVRIWRERAGFPDTFKGRFSADGPRGFSHAAVFGRHLPL